VLRGSISSPLPGQKRTASAVNAWYFTYNIEKESELLSELQEKARFDQESIGWEFAVIGIQDINFYVRLATVGIQLGVLPRGETICAHTVT
jgi:hypothetical protein